MAAAARPASSPPGLAAFLTALRWQESGSPKGNYTEPNGQGAYQILPSNWPQWVTDAGLPQWANVLPSDAPPAVQDAVARYKVAHYYYGPAKQSWRKVARLWNGGSTDPVPNPALGPGATTDTYASEVLDKLAKLPGGGAQDPTMAAVDAAAAGMSTGAATIKTQTKDCYAQLPGVGVGPVKTGGICLDPLLWGSVVALGSVALLVGTALVVVAIGHTGPGRKVVDAATTVAAPVKGVIAKAEAGQAAKVAAHKAAAKQASEALKATKGTDTKGAAA